MAYMTVKDASLKWGLSETLIRRYCSQGRIEGIINDKGTYVSQMQALGVDLPTIQSIVGHADIDMTQHYLHVQSSVR